MVEPKVEVYDDPNVQKVEVYEGQVEGKPEEKIEAEKRAEKFKKVEEQYQKKLSENPYTEEERQRGWEINNKYGRGNPLRYNQDFNDVRDKYNRDAKHEKIQAEKKLREQHYTAEGYDVSFVAPERYRDKKSLYKFVEERKHMDPRITYGNKRDAGMNIGLGKVGVSRHWLLEGKLTMSEYQKIKTQGTQEWQSDHDAYVARKVASSKAQVVGKVAKSQQHWAKVASNPYTSNPDYKPASLTVGAGTKDDPFRKSYGTEPPKDLVANYLQPIEKPKPVDLSKEMQKQKEIELSNVRQQQYTKELREGNVGIADALLNPQTNQTITGEDTRNLETFLSERGYNLAEPEKIPDSVLTSPVKYTEAREAASDKSKPMGDLRTKEPYYAGFGVKDGKMDFKYKYPEASAETQLLRKEAKERVAQYDPVMPLTQTVDGKMRFTNLKDPQVGTLESGDTLTKKDFNPYSASDPIGMAQGYQYVVPSKGVTAFPTITGQTFEAKTPTSFDTEAEAKAYLKESKPKVFSGTDNDL